MKNIVKFLPFSMPVLTAVYSVIGLIWFDWGIFHIVYLFWFENFVKIIFNRLKISSLDAVSVSGKTEMLKDENGIIFKRFNSLIYSRIIIYVIYFVFIVVGLGFVLAFAESDKEIRLNSMIKFLNVFTFRDWEFNLALLSCILDELMTYIRDFRQKKIYNINNPYPLTLPFAKEDIVIHLSILFAGLYAFLIKYPESPLLGFSAISPALIIGIFLILINFSFQIWGIYQQHFKKIS